MQFTKEELLAEKAKREAAKTSKPRFTREELLAEKARRETLKQPQQTPDIKSPSPSEGVDFDAATMVRNIPSSAGQLVSDMVAPFLSPVETFESVQSLASGAAQKLAAGDSENPQYANPENVQLADAVGQAMVDRYGGADQIKQTAMDDPVGMLSDIVGVVSGGSTMIPKYGSKVAKVANAVDPVNLAINTSKAVVSKATPDGLANSMYRRSAKFRPKNGQSQADIDAAIQTALDEGISPTTEGIEKVAALKTEHGAKIGALLDEAEASGQTIKKGKLLAGIRREINNMNPLSTPEYAKRKRQMSAVLNDFGRQWKGVDDLTPNQVQDLKLGLDDLINYNRNQQSGKFATENAQRSLRRGAKESLEELNPEIGPANQRFSDLRNLENAGLEAVASRIGRNNALGLQTPAATIAGGYVGNMLGSPELGALVGAGVSKATSGTLQADIAIALNALKNSPARAIYFDSNGQLNEVGRQALIQLGRLNDIESEQSQ